MSAKKVAASQKKKRKNKAPATPRSRLLRMSTDKPILCYDGWRGLSATSNQIFTIKQVHINRGVPNDPARCIVSLSLQDSIGKQYVYQVGAGIVKILDYENRVFIRFATPMILREQIKKWERHGGKGVPIGTWDLPPGPQVLGALPISWRLMYAGQDATRGPGKGKHAAKRVKPVIVAGSSKGPLSRKRASSTRVVGRHVSLKHF
jgi:hypothetical protein